MGEEVEEGEEWRKKGCKNIPKQYKRYKDAKKEEEEEGNGLVPHTFPPLSFSSSSCSSKTSVKK